MSKIVVAIVVNNGTVLMARRRQKEGNLHWQFPGGAANEGETDFAAAERETFEETDVICRASEVLGQRIHPTTGREISYILCHYLKGAPIIKDSEELDRVEWMTPSQVFTVVTSDIFPSVKDFLNLKKLETNK